MTESERQFLERIQAWGKKVVIALNKIDIFQSRSQLNEVRDFVLQYAGQVLGLTPDFFPVSARLAEQSQSPLNPQMRASSGIDALANYIHSTLDNQDSIRLKFTNPLGVADHIVEQAQAHMAEEAQALNEDSETVKTLEGLTTGYEKELRSELPPRLAEVDNILNRMQERGIDFFDSTMRLTNIATLARGDRVRAEFEKRVLDDVPQQIEDRVQRLIDWLVDKDLNQWRRIMAFLQNRRARFTEHISGEALTPLDTRRRALIDSVGTTAQTIVETYNRDQEARDLAISVENAVAQVALLEAGAVGLGTLVVTLLASSAADFTGLLAAGTLAVVGLFVIPYKRTQAKNQFRDKIQALREKLLSTLTTQFNNEAENVVTRMKDGVLPYTAFVQAERDRNDKIQDALKDVRQRIEGIRARATGI